MMSSAKWSVGLSCVYGWLPEFLQVNQVKYVFAIFQYLLVNSLFIKVEKLFFLGYIVAEWSIQLDSAKISTITS